MSGKRRLFSLDDASERFWSHVDIPPDVLGCWVWRGKVTDKGYGQFLYTADGKRRGMMAHRAAHLLIGFDTPKDLDLDHLCRNRRCVNPWHLDPVTHQENVRRGFTGEHNRRKTHCRQGHEYSIENTGLGSKGERVCRKCAVIHTTACKKRKAA